MKVIFIDKQTKNTTIFSCKSELSRKLGISQQTLWNWSKDRIKETDNFIISFNPDETTNKRLRRNKGTF